MMWDRRKIFIPSKFGIENMLEKALSKIRNAKTVSEVEGWMDDELSSLSCHIANRAGVERGEIGADKW